MNKIKITLLSIAILCFLSFQAFAQDSIIDNNIRKARLLRWVDGDTAHVLVTLGYEMYHKGVFRIGHSTGFDTPETWRPSSEAEREHGKAATARAKELIPEGTYFYVKDYGISIYGRYSADFFLPDGRQYSVIMIEEGFQKRDSYNE